MRKITICRLKYLLFFALVLYFCASSLFAKELPVYDAIGGDFTANSTLGHPVSMSDYRGKVVILYFGFTNCVMYCPAMSAKLAKVVQQLDEKAQEVQVVLVSVDPKRDSVERLRNYVQGFHPGFVGIVDEDSVIRKIARQFGTTYMVVKNKMANMAQGQKKDGAGQKDFPGHETENYMVAHATQFYVLDRAGQVRKLHPFEDKVEDIRATVEELL